MWRTSILAALTAGFLVFMPSAFSAPKKNQDAAETATDQDYKWLQSIKEMTGKLVTLNSASINSITFRLDTPHLAPNPKYKAPRGSNQQYQHLQNIYRQQAKIMAIRNPIQRQIKMQQLMATMQAIYYQQLQQAAIASSNPNNQPFLLAHQYKDFELDLAEKVVIRKMYLETEYDEKGNLKTYTKEEKAELRGKDTTKPGYSAKVEDLQAGQYIKINLKMPKKAKPAPALDKSDKADDKAIDKDNGANKVDPVNDKANKGDLADEKKAAKVEIVKPLITMVVILQQLDPNAPLDTTPAKKKN